MKYESVIGLEIHLQLSTKSKMFCACPSGVNAPNSAICPLCSGQPGPLPVINKEAVALAVKAGLALNARINEVSVFARKNYFYPDLPKGYQITQDNKPIISGGALEVWGGSAGKEGWKQIRITRAHLEEDAGKSLHGEGYTLVDLNRSGAPLLEIVSEPDMRTPEEAYNYLSRLKQLMQWFDISNADMEKGELRVDVNISLRPEGSQEFGERVEIKNLNSFKAVREAIYYEKYRQEEIIKAGGKIERCTMLWNEDTRATEVMRAKETAQEYRYFPEPDLPPLKLDADFIENIKKTMPVSPESKRKYYMDTYALSDYDATYLTRDKAISDYLDAVLKEGAPPKAAANWIGTVLRSKLDTMAAFATCKFSPKELAFLIKYETSGKISSKMAKEIFARAWDEGKSVEEIVESSGASQVSDETKLETWAREAIAENPKAAADVKAGNGKAIGALVGSVMKKSAGKANPAALNKIINAILKE